MTEEEDLGDRGGEILDYIDTTGHWLDYTIKQEFSNSPPPPRLFRFMPRGGSGFSDRGVSGVLPGQYSNRRADIHEKAKT
jgi:hypothetical protein